MMCYIPVKYEQGRISGASISRRNYKGPRSHWPRQPKDLDGEDNPCLARGKLQEGKESLQAASGEGGQSGDGMKVDRKINFE